MIRFATILSAAALLTGCATTTGLEASEADAKAGIERQKGII